MEFKTARTKLAVEFKRIRESGGEESAIMEAISQMRTHHCGETTEDIKLIRVAMVNMYRKEKSHCVQSHGIKTKN